MAPEHESYENGASVLSPVRLVAFSCLTFSMLLHGLHVEAGLRLQNALGMSKIIILLIVVGSGVRAAAGKLAPGIERPRNFENWETIWEGSRGGATVTCACLYNVGTRFALFRLGRR
jgi:amino acid transporter